MFRYLWPLTALMGLAACSGGQEKNGATGNTAGGEAAPAAGIVTTPVAPSQVAGSPAANLAGRERELTNPDELTILLLYYSVTGLAAPIDKWVEDDMAVRIAKPEDKPKARDAARAKINAGLAGVKDIGVLRLTMQADLSDYDPSYGEYTVRAFAPSSSLVFSHFNEQILIKFDNAQMAQRWSVPQGEAQAIKDRIRYNSGVMADARLRISGAAPSNGGGTITTIVIDYELKERSSGTTIARVSVTR
jgi:hypothetical protein